MIGTVIQVLLPLPWLRGLDGRLHLVLDWRDPAVRRVFVLMLPVTIGLGLINFNLVVNTFFALAVHRPGTSRRARSTLPSGSTCSRRGCSRSPSRRCSSRRSRGSRRATTSDGVPAHGRAGLRQIAFLLVPASVFTAVLAEPIVRLVYQRGRFTSEQTHVVAGALAAFSLGLTFNGVMLMLNRAFFSLQIAVAADLRSRSATSA